MKGRPVLACFADGSGDSLYLLPGNAGRGKFNLRQFPLGRQVQRKIGLFYKSAFSGDINGRKGFNQRVESAHESVVSISGLLNILFRLIQTVLKLNEVRTGFKLRIRLSQSQKPAQ